MADNSDVDVVKKGYEAFNNADLDTLGKLFAEDAVHHVPGKNPISGDKVGRDACLAYYGQLGELTGGTFKAPLESCEAQGGGKVKATHRAQGTRGDKVLDSRDSILFTVKDGKIVDLDETTQDQARADAFWS